MRPPRRVQSVYAVGLKKRAQLSGIPTFKSRIKKKLVVKKQLER